MDTSLLKELVYGGYAFTVGAWVWAWALYMRLMEKIERLETNHLDHVNKELKAIRKHIGMPEPEK